MKVTSIYRKDKIGTLSQNLGNVNLTSSILTIGGLQYDTEGSRSVALPAMTANTRYQIYAVVSGGDVILVVSQNENSAGPTGYTSWKLVGSFHSNGLASIGFGSFVNIVGKPCTEVYDFLPTGTWTTNSTYSGKISRKGDYAEIQYTVSLTGAPNAAQLLFNSPSNLSFQFNKLSNIQRSSLGHGQGIRGGINSAFSIHVGSSTATTIEPLYDTNGALGTAFAEGGINQTLPSAFASGDFVNVTISVPIQNWSNTAIEDL